MGGANAFPWSLWMSPLIALLLLVVTVLLVLWIGESERRSGRLPPRFDAAADGEIVVAAGRRALGSTAIAIVVYVGVLAPVALLSFDATEPLIPGSTLQLFVLHALFGGALLTWYAMGHLPRREGEPTLSSSLGLGADRPARELVLGGVVGVGIWGLVVVILVAVGLAVQSLGGGEAATPPPMVLWMASLPVWIRLLVSLSAGFFEEVFFRGFLQPRVGIVLSTAMFALAHLSYAQPMMLVGVTLLSLCYGLLTKWRGSVWAAVAAHTVFDAIQLIVVIPAVVEQLEVLPSIAGG